MRCIEIESYTAELSMYRPIGEGGDVAEATLRPRGWHVELIQLGPAQLRTSHAPPAAVIECIALDLGPAALLRGLTPRGRIAVACAHPSSPPLRITSRPLGDGACLVLGSKARLDLYLPENSRGWIVSIASSACDSAYQLPARGESEFRSLGYEDRSRLLQMFDTTELRGQESPASLQAPSASSSCQQLASAAARVITECALLPPDPDEKAVRRFAVQRACKYIDAHLRTRITLADLCNAAGAGARTLEYGFREFYDVGPMTFLRSLRLSRVRRDLSQVTSGDISVAVGARRWYFSHMGQFSRDYRLLFGESPSTTLARARDRTARAPPR